MNKLRTNFLATLFVSAALFVSCDDTENKPKGNFEKGVFVINEGNYGSGNGTVTFYNINDKSTTADIFGLVNDERALGDVVQSMTITGDEAYIVVNNDNKVEITNANTFEAIHTLTDVKLPRYFATANGKGYLTEWVSFAESGRVSVVDLKTHAIIKTIATDDGSENLIAVGTKIFVSNNFTNTISVINTSTDAVVNTIEVASSPGEFVLDAQNKLWVICGGDYTENNGALVQIDPSTEAVVKTIELTRNVPVKLATDKTKNFLYFYAGKSVYKVSIAATTEPTEALLTEDNASSFYGMDVDSNNGVLYIGDPEGFISNGTVYRYNLDGSFIDSFEAGKGPNGFVFK